MKTMACPLFITDFFPYNGINIYVDGNYITKKEAVMFQKEIIPEKVLTYIGENHILLEIIAAGILLLILLSVLFQLSRMKREIRKICRQVRKYLDVVMSGDAESETEEEEEDAEEEMPEPEMDLQQIHTYQRRRELDSVKKSQKPEEEKQSQKDAELLMEVISDVF